MKRKQPQTQDGAKRRRIVTRNSSPLEAGSRADWDTEWREDQEAQKVKNLVARYSHTNDADTALYLAVELGRLEDVQLLLKHCSNVNVHPEIEKVAGCCYSPIVHVAARRRSCHFLQDLLDAGADVNAKNRMGDHVLVTAAQRQSATDIWCLLHHEAIRGSEGFEEACHDALCHVLSWRCVRVCEVLWPTRQHTTNAKLRYIQALIFTKGKGKNKFFERILNESSEIEQIYLYELQGAKCVLSRDLSGAGTWWSKAMDLRWRDSTQPILKQEPSTSLAQVAGHHEVQTPEDLQALIRSEDADTMRFQAMLILERLMPSCSCYHNYVFSRAQNAFAGGDTARGGSFLRCVVEAAKKTTLGSWCRGYTDFVAFISHQSWDKGAENGGLTLQSLLPLLDVFIQVISEDVARTRDKKWGEYRVSHVCRRSQFCNFLETAIVLFNWTLDVLCRLQGTSSRQDVAQLERKLDSVMQMQGQSPRWSFKCPLSWNLGPPMEKAVLESSARVHGNDRHLSTPPPHLTRDSQGRLPFHVYADTLSKEELLGEEGIVAFMENHGAHLCIRNSQTGERVLDVLERRGLLVPGYRPPPLRCLAARVAAQMAGSRVRELDCIPDCVKTFILDH